MGNDENPMEVLEAAERHPELECVLVPIPRGELLARKPDGAR